MSKIQRAQASDGKDAPDHAIDGAEGVDAAHGWARSSVTFRLTEERRRALLEIAPGLGLRATPTAAIDFAIERAAGIGVASTLLNAEDPNGWGHEAVEELRAVLAACAALRNDGAQTRAIVERLESRLTEFGGAKAATDSPPPTRSLIDEVEVTHASLTLGAWLDQETGSKFSWAVVKARWIEARPAEMGKAMLRVEAWAAAPFELAGQTAVLRPVEVGPLRLGALAAFERDSVGVFVCSRSAEGWTARIHSLDEQGKLGPELDCFAA